MPRFVLSRLPLVLFAFSALGLSCRGDDGESAEAPAGIRTEAVATALPTGAMVVVSGDDLESFWSRLQGTSLYTELAAIEGVQGTMAPLAEGQQEIQDEICIRPDEQTLMTILGERFDLGFYGPLADDRVDAVLVADVAEADQARAMIEECEGRLSSERGATFTDEEYAGEEIRVATNGEGEEVLFYAVSDDRLTIATTRTRFQQIIDVAGGDDSAGSMTADERYVDVLEKLPEASLVVYVDQQALMAVARSAADSAAAMGDTAAAARGEALSAALQASEDFRFTDAVGIGLGWEEAGIRGVSYALFPPAAERSALVEMFAGPPAEIRTLVFQPESTLAYWSLNSLDARTIYDALYDYAVGATRVQMAVEGTADSTRADSVVAANVRRFESEAGIDIEEDIVSWVGEEVAFALTGVARGGFFPIPELAMTVGVTDTERARAFFSTVEGRIAEAARVRASVPIQWQEEEHEGQTIRYAPTPMGEGLSLSYVVTPEFAIVATNHGLVRRMLDARAGRAEALPANPGFGEMTNFYPDRASGLGYMNLEGILNEIEDLMANYGQMAGGGAAMADSTSTARRVIDALKNAPRLGFYVENDEAGTTGHFLLEVR